MTNGKHTLLLTLTKARKSGRIVRDAPTNPARHFTIILLVETMPTHTHTPQSLPPPTGNKPKPHPSHDTDWGKEIWADTKRSINEPSRQLHEHNHFLVETTPTHTPHSHFPFQLETNKRHTPLLTQIRARNSGPIHTYLEIHQRIQPANSQT